MARRRLAQDTSTSDMAGVYVHGVFHGHPVTGHGKAADPAAGNASDDELRRKQQLTHPDPESTLGYALDDYIAWNNWASMLGTVEFADGLP